MSRDSTSTDHATAQLANELRATAPECLANFATEIEAERTRTAYDTTSEETGAYSERTGKPIMRVFTNKRSQTVRLEALAADWRWATEEAHVEVASEEEGLESIQQRRAAWPQLEFAEVK